VLGVVRLLVCPAFPLLFPGRAFAGRLMVVQAATCRVSLVKVLFHSAFHGVASGQCVGRCRVRLPWGLIRARTFTKCRRRMAPRALAWVLLARVPAARSRLWVDDPRRQGAAGRGCAHRAALEIQWPSTFRVPELRCGLGLA